MTFSTGEAIQLKAGYHQGAKAKNRKAVAPKSRLKPLMAEILADAYYSALAVAERDTGIDEEVFPETCPWDFDRIRDEGFWPE